MLVSCGAFVIKPKKASASVGALDTSHLCVPPVVACLQTRSDQPRERRGENKARYDYDGNPKIGVGAECGQIQHRNYSRAENDRISH